MVRRSNPAFSFYTSLCLAMLFIAGCSNNDTPEDQVRQFIQAGVDAVENRDVSDVRDLISESYRDGHGNDRQMVVRTLAGYFLGNKHIHVLTDIRHIHFPDEQHAEVQLLAGIAGQPTSDFASLLNIRANVYKFDLRLSKNNGDWQLVNARWSVADRQDLFSE